VSLAKRRILNSFSYLMIRVKLLLIFVPLEASEISDIGIVERRST